MNAVKEKYERELQQNAEELKEYYENFYKKEIQNLKNENKFYME